MKALIALALLACAAGCKKPTQQQYLQLATLPPAGAPEFHTTTAPEHFKEDFVLWKKVPIRVRWKSALDEGSCRRILGADLSRTGGPVEYVVMAPMKANVDLHDQWMKRAPCQNGVEVIQMRITAKHGRDDLTADFTIDGAGAITPAKES